MKRCELAQKAISLDESARPPTPIWEFNIPILGEHGERDCSLPNGPLRSPEFHGRLFVFFALALNRPGDLRRPSGQ